MKFITWCVWSSSLHVPASPILCVLVSPGLLIFFPSGLSSPTALSEQLLLNTIDSAKCSKCCQILIATLQGWKRLNDFQGHKLRKGLIWALNLRLPDCKGSILFLYNMVFFTKPPASITHPQELFWLQVFSSDVDFSSDMVALLSEGSIYTLKFLSYRWMWICIFSGYFM